MDIAPSSSGTSKDFKFKYVPEEEFEQIVNEVQQLRKKSYEDDKWLRQLDEEVNYKFKVHCQFVESQLTPEYHSHFPHEKIKKKRGKQLEPESRELLRKELERCEAEIKSHEEPSSREGIKLQPVPEENISDNDQSSQRSKYSCGGTEMLMKIPSPAIPKKKDSTHISRIRRFRKLIKTSLDTVCCLLSVVPEPDGEEDYKRREQRTAEFSSWICRNYHYKLQRQICEMKKQLRSPCTGAHNTFLSAVCQKLVSAYQTTSQALQAYIGHIPCSVGFGLSRRLEEMLKLVIQLSQLTSKAGVKDTEANANLGDSIEMHCINLIQKLKSQEYENWHIENCESQGAVPRKVSRSKYKVDLSMYESRTQQNKFRNCWKRSSAMLAKAKFGPPAMKDVPESVKSDKNKIDTMLKKRNYKTYETDGVMEEIYAKDNIKTMMDVIPPVKSEDEDDVSTEGIVPPYQLPEERPDKCIEINSKEELINNLIDVTETVRNVMEEGWKNIEQNQKITLGSKREKISKHNAKCKKNSKALDINLDALKCIENMMQQLEHQASPSQQPRKENLERSSSNVKFICMKHEPPIKDNPPISNDNAESEMLSKGTKALTVSPSQEEISSQGENMQENLSTKTGNTPSTLSGWESTTVGKMYDYKDGVLLQHPVETVSEIHEVLSDTNEKDFNTVPFEAESFTKGSEIFIKQLSANNAMKREQKGSEMYDLIEIKKQVGVMSNIPPFNEEECKDSSKLEHYQDTEVAVKLSISHVDELSALNYHKRFNDYKISKSMYRESKKPWLMMTRLANHLIQDILNDVVVNEIGINKITQHLVEMELNLKS